MAILGIDLGTTYSVMATMEDGRVLVLSNVEGRQTTPSVIFFQDDSLDNALVGDCAVYSAGNDPAGAIRAIKRHMGTDFAVKRGNNTYTPEQVSAAILKKLIADAKDSLGEAVTDAVITVPAYFEAAEREATRKAGEMAGLTVRALLDEPVAAAIDFAQTRGEELAGKTVLVFDLGGGTFDVTVMRVSREGGSGSSLAFDVIGKDGSRTLGGLDWDQALAEHVAAEFVKAHPGKSPADDPRSFDILMLQCQQAKEAISFKADPDNGVSVTCTHEGVSHSVLVSRRQFEELTLPLLSQTADKASQLVAGLAGRGVTWQTIDHILLAGGSTKMPAVAAMLEGIAGKPPVTNKGVDFNVGRGAAYLAFSPGAWTVPGGGLPPEKQTAIVKHGPRYAIRTPPTGIVNHSVGITVSDFGTGKERNFILLEKNTPVNTRSKEESFQTVEVNQSAVDIIINKGESENLESLEQLGTVRISDLPPGAAGQLIKVWLSYDSDGLIVGEATHLASGRRAEIKVSLTKKSS